MASIFYVVLFSFMVASTIALIPPSPGYFPSSRISPVSFDHAFRNLWGPQHQRVEHGSLTIWLDSSSGSGFKSLHSYRSGYFGAAIKLQPGYTAGVITSLYLSNNQDHPGNHDEIDIEFLGTTPDKPYVLQTNVYIRGSGDRNIIGREMKFHLWFDPTQDFHNYAVLWKPSEIIFLVDDVPIRSYPRRSEETYPTRPMYVYGSIWDASSWATDNGRYRADYRYQPFIGRYKMFRLEGCTSEAESSCRPPSISPSAHAGLSPLQVKAMQWVHSHYLVYNYCHDSRRDRTLTPEC